jgi:uncharacterized protein YjbI with pentapeptide repeats
MAIRLGKIWSAIQELNWKQGVDTVKTGAESAKAVFDLAKTINEKKPDAQQLKPYIEQISSLLDVLNSPIAQIVKDTIPFAPIAVTILQLICDATKKEPTIEQCVALVAQVAYLESLRSLLLEDSELLSRVGGASVSEGVSKKIREVGDLELSNRDARKAILFFQESNLATAFSAVLEARLLETGLQPTEVRSVSERVSRRTNNHINIVLATVGEKKISPLVEWYRVGGHEKFEQYISIEEYLRDFISPDSKVPHLRDRWHVFNEEFTLKHIYVPLKAQFLDKNGEPERRAAVVLEEWAKAVLNNPDKEGTVMFIQGGPGRGKSVFCRMFAEWVRQHEHPNWTPILIRLRDIRTLDKDFEATLRKAVDWDFARSDDGWLSDRNTRFIFLLDGFDELLMEGRTSSGLESFLDQVGKFQRSCQSNPEKRHRVLITGRTLSLQGIEWQMPNNLERIELLEMDDVLQGQWFSQWLMLIGREKTQAFQAFLSSEQCPERIKQLAREPLLLYLLAAMHRDGELDLTMFEGAEGVQAKILIYEKTIDWVLTMQRSDRGSNLNNEITELDTESLRTILAEAGLSVVQAGGECAPLSMIEKRLEHDAKVKDAIAQARDRVQDNPLRNALAAFYLQPGKSGSGSVEFIHKSFGEFLCAERLKETIESWTEEGRKRERFYVPTQQMNEEIYDLLGSPVLSQEIVEYLMALLTRSSEFKPVELFDRLNEFYERWCDGEFIDAPPENLPQRKMRLFKEQLPEQELSLGLRQVDVYGGLNVMVLLLELHRYAQSRDDLKEKIVFYPSGQTVEGDRYSSRLRKIISYSDCLRFGEFTALVDSFLASANLRSTDLSSANLSSANLSSANLSSANLRSTDLSSANLSSANLSRANLSSANLSRANLSRANLSSADLSSANLSSANFFSTNLRRANLSRADLSSANLSSANLSSADLSSADLFRANLSSANLSSTNLRRADLNSTDLRSTDLSRADFSSANLSSANFSSANLRSTDLSSANLSSADLSSADLSSADFSSANLSSANLSSANLENANLSFADIKDIVWNKNTNWTGVIGLETARNVSIALKEKLGL